MRGGGFVPPAFPNKEPNMKNLKAPKILFFTKGRVPTASEREAADKLGVPVCFRNASFIDPESGVEPCAGVAGAVPKNYAKEFESASKVIGQYAKAVKEHNEQLKALDTPAPQTPPKDPTKEPANGTGDTPPAPVKPPEGWKAGN